MTQIHQQECVTFKLPATFNIETAEHITTALNAILAQHPPCINIDISSAEYVTTAGFQVLIALEKSLASKGLKMNLTGQNDAFYLCMKDLGLLGLIGQSKE